MPTRAQTALYLEFRRLMDRAVRWLLQTRPTISDIGAEIERFSAVIDVLRPKVPELLVGAEQRRLQRRAQELIDLGVPEELAVECASLLDVYSLLDIAEIGYDTETPIDRVAPMYFTLSERFQVDTMLTLITRLPRDDRWDALARAALRYDLYAALEQLTISVLTTSDGGLDTEERIAEWERSNRATLDRVRDMVGEVSHLDRTGIAALSVALRGLRGVVRSNSATA